VQTGVVGYFGIAGFRKTISLEKRKCLPILQAITCSYPSKGRRFIAERRPFIAIRAARIRLARFPAYLRFLERKAP
jgi:hypothetical protein